MNTNTAYMLHCLSGRFLIRWEDALALRRLAMTLHHWYEMECNGEIERNEDDGKPYRPQAPALSGPIPDREMGANIRLAKIMAQYPDLGAYHQTDPRGAPLYIYRKTDLEKYLKLNPCATIRSCYTSIGIAVHK